ncbi:MAG: DNA repair protein RecO [Anaerolineae bacterium]
MSRTERLYNTDAIILRRSDFGEADRMLTVFTPGRGKLRLLAKGVRKTKSRKAGHVELFTHAALQVAAGRNIDIVTQAETVQAYRALRDDLDKIGRAGYVVELVDKFTQEGDANYAIFELLALTLARLADGSPAEQQLALRYLELHLLGLAGFRPQLHFCLSCNRKIKPDANYFHVAGGGVLCPECGAHQPAADSMSVGALKVLRFLQTRPWEQAARLQLTSATHTEVERLLLRTIAFTLERGLKSVAFLRKLRRDKQRGD